MPTLIVNPRYSQDSRAIEDAARKAGWKFHKAYRWEVPPDVEDPVVYGDMAFCDAMSKKLGIVLIEPPLDWLPTLPEFYLQRHIELVQHKDLGRYETRKFIKPANDKVFLAGIYEKGEYVPRLYIQDTCPVLVSDVVDFEIEIRCYIADRKLLTAAPYQWKGSVFDSQREEATLRGGTQWVQYLLEDPRVELPPSLTIDIGFTPQGWAVVEANQLYSSGIYTSADLDALLPGLLRSASRTFPAEELKYQRFLP